MAEGYKVITFAASKLPEQYHAMIFSKFLRSLRYGNQYFRLIDQKAYFDVYQKYLATIMARAQAEVKLAVLADDFDVVLGWSLLEPHKVHYVYVNRDNRNIGIGASLLPAHFETFTHLTNKAMTIWNKKFPHATFNPFA